LWRTFVASNLSTDKRKALFMGKLDGQIALITGAGKGIGQAISVRFHEEGAILALIDTDEKAIKALANTLGSDVIYRVANVSNEKSVQTAIQTVIEELGKIDILVNNAAAQAARARVSDLALAEWQEAIDVNLTGTFLVSRAALQSMMKSGYGVIINVASQLGSVAVQNASAYCASKGGVLQLTRAMALDHATDGVRVNSLSPGAVLTERLTMIYGSMEEASAALAPKHPIGRVGMPNDIAGAAVFLASNDSGFMTGANLVIDGGYTAQ
jgi:NAD(P)-dependent dehydrogenase (short-subunit alcohol dehydrogenase family)